MQSYVPNRGPIPLMPKWGKAGNKGFMELFATNHIFFAFQTTPYFCLPHFYVCADVDDTDAITSLGVVSIYLPGLLQSSLCLLPLLF